MYEYLKQKNIPTALTFNNLNDFYKAYNNKEISFPVFIKPISGSASTGAQKIETKEQLEKTLNENKYTYIIQEYMAKKDVDVDVYVDTISKEIISIFAKDKIEMRPGGTSKSISFKDERLFNFVKEVLDNFDCAGVADLEIFIKNGKYYLNEINPRFSGAYLHAYGAGVDFFKFIEKNVKNIKNTPQIGNYDEGIVMLMYDEVVITKEQDLKKDFRES